MRGEIIFTAIKMKCNHAKFTHENISSAGNKSALYIPDISLDDWVQAVNENLKDPDEMSFIVCGEAPAAWLKINGLQGEQVWISMLVVHELFKRQGIGRFAVQFAESFVKAKGYNALHIKTTADNDAARVLYLNLGFKIISEGEWITNDGVDVRGYTFFKELI